MSNPKKHLPRRYDDEWYKLIMDCRKSGLSDSQYCRANGIPNSSFCTAIRRLRMKSVAIPERTDADIYMTSPCQARMLSKWISFLILCIVSTFKNEKYS